MKLPNGTSRGSAHRGRRAFLATLLSVSLALSTGAPLALADGTDGVAAANTAASAQLTSGSDALFTTDTIVQIRPHGYYRTVNIEDDFRTPGKGQDVQLYSLGTSSKQRLRQTTNGYYTIQAQRDFTEQSDDGSAYWDVEGASNKAGAIVHVWNNGPDSESSQWKFTRNSDGTYYIQNRKSEKYLSLEHKKDENNVKLIQDEYSNALTWDVDVVKGNVACSTRYHAKDWMTSLPGSMLLSEVTIPGTHDSGTCYTYGDIAPQDSFTTCQQLFIDEQLNQGIRFFDIRVGMDGLEDRDPYINHGGTVCEDRNGKKLRLSAVVEDMKDFLMGSHYETIIMMVSHSGGDTDNQTSSLAKLIEANPTLFYTSSKVPTLDEVRGKIVLFTRFAPSGSDASKFDYGLCLDNWGAYNDAYARTKGLVQIKSTSELDVYVQDNYSSHADEKIAYVQGAFNDAATKYSEAKTLGKGAWVINYTSCTKDNPFSAARNMNERLYKESCLSDDTPGFLGIVVMDFVDARQAESIWKQNDYEAASEDKVVTGVTSKGLKYTIVDGNAYITGYAGNSTSVTLPKSIKGAPVVSVALKSAGLKVLKPGKATELRYLNCKGNKLTALNVSKNTKLRTLYCQNNKLTKITVSATGNKALKKGVFVIGKASQNKLPKAERTRLCLSYNARSNGILL